MMIDCARLPREVWESTRAVIWKYEQRAGRRTKVPYQPGCPTRRAAVDEPATWGPFAEAVAVVAAGRADGAGIVLGDGLSGGDLDHCRDPVSGALDLGALEIVRTLDSYTEISPSGTGVHVLVHGALPAGRRRCAGIELYSERHFLTMTGAHLEGTPLTIEERTAALAALHARVFGRGSEQQPVQRRTVPVEQNDAALLARARAARNGRKFAALYDAGDVSGYPSHSEADLALVSLLVFWTGGDAARVDTFFRSSGLMRGKWDAPRGTQTYGERTITVALARTTNRRTS
jgi:putative DNA primase/helicase